MGSPKLRHTAATRLRPFVRPWDGDLPLDTACAASYVGVAEGAEAHRARLDGEVLAKAVDTGCLKQVNVGWAAPAPCLHCLPLAADSDLIHIGGLQAIRTEGKLFESQQSGADGVGVHSGHLKGESVWIHRRPLGELALHSHVRVIPSAPPGYTRPCKQLGSAMASYEPCRRHNLP